MKKIGVYGGTFNPPHMGHIKAAQNAAEELRLDHVFFIPAGTPPHKEMPAGSPTDEQRLEMMVRAVDPLPFAMVLDVELRRSGKSYTVDTLEWLCVEYPEDEFYLLMGTDMFLSFDQWHMPERICSLAKLVAFYREKNDLKQERLIYNQAERLSGRFDAQVEIVENDFIEISSSVLRSMLAFSCGQDYIPQSVYEYIVENRLYSIDKTKMQNSMDDMRSQVVALMQPMRAAHVLGCEEEAASLAGRWNVSEKDARAAAILHDITKSLDRDEQLLLCENYDIIIDKFEEESHSLLHAKTGAAIAGAVFGAPRKVCEAIACHTTGKADMTCLDKILYLADYIEPGRKIADLEKLRVLAYEDLNEAVLLGLNMTVAELKSKGKIVHPRAYEAIDFLAKRKDGTE